MLLNCTYQENLLRNRVAEPGDDSEGLTRAYQMMYDKWRLGVRAVTVELMAVSGYDLATPEERQYFREYLKICGLDFCKIKNVNQWDHIEDRDASDETKHDVLNVNLQEALAALAEMSPSVAPTWNRDPPGPDVWKPCMALVENYCVGICLDCAMNNTHDCETWERNCTKCGIPHAARWSVPQRFDCWSVQRQNRREYEREHE